MRLPPARALMIVLSAVAVLPPLPMTLPRSSGCTRTSSNSLLAIVRSSTVASSGLSTIARTRCWRVACNIITRSSTLRRPLQLPLRQVPLQLPLRQVPLRLPLQRVPRQELPRQPQPQGPPLLVLLLLALLESLPQEPLQRH